MSSQLINVLLGDISSVPAPALSEETAGDDGSHMIRRIMVKP